MNEIKRQRANAARCLRMAKSAQDKDEKQSWLAMAESWLTTVQLRSTVEDNFRVTEDEKAKALVWAAQ
jgi:hypothetical protein